MKKLFSKHTFFLLLTTVLLAACSDEKEEPQPVTPSITWADGQSSPTFATAGGTEAVLFAATADWKAGVDQSWCKVAPSQGAAGEDCEVRITVEPNDTPDERTATLTIRSGEVTEQLTIVQVQKDAIVVAQSEYEMESEGGTLDFSINTNVEFTVSISADWIRQNPDTRALEEVPLSFVIDANTANEPREAVITFTSDNVEQTVTVRQKAYLADQTLSITFTGTSFTVPTLAGAYFAGNDITWGDGTTEPYKAATTHPYESLNTYTVTIRSQGAETFTMQDIAGVSEIDLSGF